MKNKKYKEKYSNKAKKKPIKKKKVVDVKWVVTITIISFLISLAFSFFGETVVPNTPFIISILVVFIFVGMGIIFDIIGISVTVADSKTFNSMATKKVKGANLAIKLIKNSEKVSSFCNDVIGDICGIISGSTGVAIAVMINKMTRLPLILSTLIITAIIASLTIGGKAIGKSYAINKSNEILYRFVKIISIFYRN